MEKLVELYCDASAQPLNLLNCKNIQTYMLLTKAHEEQLEQQNKLHYCSQTRKTIFYYCSVFPTTGEFQDICLGNH